MGKKSKLTTRNGIPVTNDQSLLAAGKEAGYTLYNDTYLFEKLAAFTPSAFPRGWSMPKTPAPTGISR